jgi:hypothetical protein
MIQYNDSNGVMANVAIMWLKAINGSILQCVVMSIMANQWQLLMAKNAIMCGVM